MFPDLSLNTPSQPKDFPMPKPISLDEIKESIPQRLDQLKLGCFHMKIILISSFILLTQGFEIGDIFLIKHSYSSSSYMLIKSYDYIAKTCFITGQIIGSLLFSILTIHKNRLTSMRLLVILYCLGVFASYFTHNQEKETYDLIINSMMNLFRFLIGIVFGGFNVSLLSIIGEVIPKKRRGQVQVFLISVFIPLGLIMYIISIKIFQFYFSASGNIINLSRLIPLILIFPLLFITNSAIQSPRWEMFVGRFRDALEMINEIDNRNTGEKISARSNNGISQRVMPNLMFNKNNFALKRTLKCIRVTSRRFIHCISILCLLSLVQYWLVLNINHSHFINVDLYITKSYKLPTDYLIIIQPTVQVIGGLLMTVILNTMKRKIILIIVIMILILSSALIGVNTLFQWFDKVYELMIMLIMIAFGSCLNLGYNFLSELFPFEYRLQIICFGNIIHLMIGEMCLTVLYWIDYSNSDYLFYLGYSIICLLMIIIIWFTGIDTRNKSLEELTVNIELTDFREVANSSKV